MRLVYQSQENTTAHAGETKSPGFLFKHFTRLRQKINFPLRVLSGTQNAEICVQIGKHFARQISPQSGVVRVWILPLPVLSHRPSGRCDQRRQIYTGEKSPPDSQQAKWPQHVRVGDHSERLAGP